MRIPYLLQFVIAAALFTCCAAPARSHLNVAAPVIDLGTIRGGQNLTHRFELANSGGEVIEILDVERGCGCLATQLDQRVIPASKKATLSLELRTLGQADGPHTWHLKVNYRVGEETKTLSLSVRGVIQSEITVQPAVLGLHVSKTVQQEITLTDSRPTPLRVVDAEARAPGVKVMHIERAGKITKILVTADGSELSAGRHEGLIAITTDDADYRQLRVPVVVTKTATTTVRCFPERVELRPMAGVSKASVLVRLRSLNGQPVRIAAIKPSVATLQCTWAPGPGNDATLKIQATDQTEMAAATIEVRLATPPGGVVRIPISMRAAD